MRSPAFAIAWHLWTRHRSGIVTALVTLAVMLAASPLLPLVARTIASGIVLVVVTAYFANVLLFTEAIGNLESNYPRRMYALPVSNRTLVGWPMLFGGAIAALLWMTGACLVYRPSGFRTPVLLPSLGLAAMLMWLQAFAWSPIKNQMLKSVILIGFLSSLVALPLWMVWIWREGLRDVFPSWIAQPVMFALLVTYMAAAYGMARAGIASDRRGDTWQVLPWGILRALADPRPVRWRRPFRSPAEAQLWYEWDCHGLGIPVSCGLLLLLMCGVTILRHGVGFANFLTLFLIIPVSTAGLQSFSLGSPKPYWVKSRALITFLATRPMTSGAMIAAKLRMTALSVLLMFAIMTVEIALWAVVGGYTEEAGELGRLIVSALPGWRAGAVLVLGAVTLLAFTWGLVTAGFPIVLTGRHSLLVGFNLAAIAGAAGLGAAVIGLTNHPAYLARLLEIVPWLAAAATAIKVVVASLAFRACRRLGLIGIRSTILLIALSLALAACATALAALLLEAQVLPVPMSVVLLGIVLLVPLGRLALAPLAFEWNRHR